MSVGDEFGRRAADDELCAAVRQAVEEGDADALRRLGFSGWGDYVQRLSELMNESVRDELDYSPDFGALMSQVASPARYAHHLVTESGTAVQTAKDTPLGIHVKPLEPEFDDDALKGTVGTAASMDDPERAVGNLADGLAYAVKKAGNDFIKANAEQRSRAGFEVKVKRSGSTKCCPWCAARIGSWAIANAPNGVFGCHANCSCVVEYTSSTGAKTSASDANLNRLGAGAFTEIEYQPPHVLSREEAREKGGFDKPKRLTKNPVESQPHRLTGAANGGIINYAKVIDSMFYADDYEYQTYTKEEIIEHLKTSPVGLDTIRYLEENPKVKVKLTEDRESTNRGQHDKNLLTIWLNNCPNVRVAAQTVVHEVAHHKYNIGGSQLAETICFAFEKMHKEGRDYVTREEWNKLAELVRDVYRSYPSEGGVGDFERFKKFIKDR